MLLRWVIEVDVGVEARDQESSLAPSGPS